MSAKNAMYDSRYDPNDPSTALTADGQIKVSQSVSGDADECFYQLCTKENTCGLPCFRFKDRNHAFICYLLTLLLVCLFVAIIFPLVLYALVDQGVNESIVVDSTSASSYETWQTNTAGKGLSDIQITYNLYFFDLQNPQEVIQGEQPVVVEVGPYAYREYYYKFDISWSDDGDTVTYNNYRHYIFAPDLSGAGLTETDQLTLPYPTVLGFEYLLGKIPPEVNEMFDYAIERNLTIMEQSYLDTVQEMYDDLIPYAETTNIHTQDAIQDMADLAAFNQSIQAYFDEVFLFIESAPAFTLFFKTLLCKSPYGISPFFKKGPSEAWFGWLNDPVLLEVQGLISAAAPGTPWSSAVPGAAYNYTSIQDARRRRNVDVQKTGKKNPKQAAQYVRYQNMTIMHTCVNSMASQNTSAYVEGKEFPACEFYQYEWNETVAESKGYTTPFATPYSNRVAGCDANMFGRPVTTDLVQAFISDIYRSAFMDTLEFNTDWYGITTRKLGLQSQDIENSTVVPANAQYFAFGPKGLLNATKAAGIPTFISFPHFYLGDDRLVSAVKGLSPDANLHETYLLVEPQTGLLAKARKRIQLSYLVSSYAMPELQNKNAPEDADAMCKNVRSFTVSVQRITGKNYSPPTCGVELKAVEILLTCFIQPSTWKIRNEEIFFPYGWVSEEVTMPQSYADDLNDSLFAAEDLAVAIRFWCLVAAGILFGMILAVLYYIRTDESQGRKYYRLNRNKMDSTEPLDFAFNANATEPLLNNSPAGKNGPNGKPRDSYSFSA